MSKFIILCRHCHFQSRFSSSATYTTNGDWVRMKVFDLCSWKCSLMAVSSSMPYSLQILQLNNLLKTSIQHFLLLLLPSLHKQKSWKYLNLNWTYFATVYIFYSRFSEEKVHKISFSYWTNKVWRWNTILKKKKIFIIEHLWLSISEIYRRKKTFSNA